MIPPPPNDTLTVLYDGACPLCRREIAHVQGLAQRQGRSALCFVDISRDDGVAAPADPAWPAPPAMTADQRAALLARFHVQRADGTRLSGAAAFVAMWGRLPGWRWLARLARLPGMLALLELAYRGFLRLRPALQAVARRLEPARQPAVAPDAPETPAAPAAPADASTPATPGLPLPQPRDLRCDHAGKAAAGLPARRV